MLTQCNVVSAMKYDKGIKEDFFFSFPNKAVAGKSKANCIIGKTHVMCRKEVQNEISNRPL